MLVPTTYHKPTGIVHKSRISKIKSTYVFHIYIVFLSTREYWVSQATQRLLVLLEFMVNKLWGLTRSIHILRFEIIYLALFMPQTHNTYPYFRLMC